MKETDNYEMLSDPERAAYTRMRITDMTKQEFADFQHELQAAYVYHRTLIVLIDKKLSENIEKEHKANLIVLRSKYQKRGQDIFNSVMYDEIRNQISQRQEVVVGSEWTGWVDINENQKKGIVGLVVELTSTKLSLMMINEDVLRNKASFYENSIRRQLKNDYGIHGVFFNTTDYMRTFFENYL